MDSVTDASGAKTENNLCVCSGQNISEELHEEHYHILGFKPMQAEYLRNSAAPFCQAAGRDIKARRMLSYWEHYHKTLAQLNHHLVVVEEKHVGSA